MPLPRRKRKHEEEETGGAGQVKKPRPAKPTDQPDAAKPPAASGQVYVVGQGDTGQLGLGEDIMEKKKPSPVGGALSGLRVVQVACGGMHTAALTDGGEVFTWGCNDEGALGRETEEGEEYVPGQVPSLKGVTQISAGDSHTAALTSAGDVYCWGVFRDSRGPFGLVQAGSTCPTPTVVYSSPTHPAEKVASGDDHVVILTKNGVVISFGCAEQGQLGRVPEVFSSRGGRKGIQRLLQPQQVRFRKSRRFPVPKFVDVFCGSYNTFALTEDKGVYVSGMNNFGQLGTDDLESRYQPVRLPEDWLDDRGYEGFGICSGQHHTVLCSKGCVYVMGRREYGRLGLGEKTNMEPSTPYKVQGLSDVVAVAAGSSCSFAVTKSGELYSWGMGTNLQLGTGKEDDVWKPTKVASGVLAADIGGQHSALLRKTTD